MILKLIVTTTLILCVSVTYSQKNLIKTGKYKAGLLLNKSTVLPVNLIVEKDNKQNILVISNAAERIELKLSKKLNDTLYFQFPNYDSELRLVTKNKNSLNGYWVNLIKKDNYQIPFFAEINQKSGKTVNTSLDLSGNWETYFAPNSSAKNVGLTVIKQNNNTLTGTVLTETGDYRYMQGTVDGDHFYLSSFDGSHAFLISGKYDRSNLIGNFYSGKHYQTDFKAILNPDFKLRDPDSLTYLKNDQSEIEFQLNDVDGNSYNFPNISTLGKVVIIQIMGTWCPNCMDETKYYKELYDKYHNDGLEIISVGFEAAETFSEQANRIKRLRDRHNLNFTFLVGGKATKNNATEQFKMLNQVMSFPTSIYIDRSGKVRRIHTGFNGPGTGDYYTSYVQKTQELIELMLLENTFQSEGY